MEATAMAGFLQSPAAVARPSARREAGKEVASRDSGWCVYQLPRQGVMIAPLLNWSVPWILEIIADSNSPKTEVIKASIGRDIRCDIRAATFGRWDDIPGMFGMPMAVFDRIF